MRANRAHRVPERAPLQVAEGQVVEVGDRDTEWPEFVFLVTDAGSGWVPARHLSADHGTAIVVEPYDTTELPVAEGEEVVVTARDDQSGWWWCRSEDGTEGWVPRSVFE